MAADYLGVKDPDRFPETHREWQSRGGDIEEREEAAYRKADERENEEVDAERWDGLS